MHGCLLRVFDGHLPPVGQVNQKRPERPLPQRGEHAFIRHGTLSRRVVV